MSSGYWQIPVAEEDKEKTAFLTRYGLYQFTRMPFGLSNSPATFQRAMHIVLNGLIWERVIVYLDDINVMGATMEETLDHLEVVLLRFQEFGLKLKPRKCALFLFLGRLATREGVHVTDEHITSVRSFHLGYGRLGLCYWGGIGSGAGCKRSPHFPCKQGFECKTETILHYMQGTLAVVVFVQHYEHSLLGRPFLIHTDHASLAWLMRCKMIGGQLCRWLEYLARFSYSIQHRSGQKHSNADGLSRILQEVTCDCYDAGKQLDSLPCWGFKFCEKMAADWERYEELVDDVLPLSMSHELSREKVPTRDVACQGEL